MGDVFNQAYLLEWANLLLRWLHVIVAIAWIGTSFHFVLTDDRLYKPTDPESLAKGVDGESWAVHGGGFYHFNKYRVAPKLLPDHLHWSYWESYSTWLSGFALLTVLYFVNASSFLVDPRVFDWSPGAAIAGAIAYLVVGWVVYDGICRLVGRDADANGKMQVGGDLKVGVLVFVYVCAAAWVACHLFAGRAAFLLTGAMLATLMSANVAMVIIPGQRKVVAALREGKPVDPVHGQRGKQRSVHNTYFTLPVVFAMISNHYGFAYGAKYNWLVLVVLMLAGALVRVSFVMRHKALVEARPVPWRYAVVGTLMIVATVGVLMPASQPAVANLPPPSFAEVQAIVQQRCQLCHNAQLANKNVRLDSADQIHAHAQEIYQQAVVLKVMPMSNATQITDAERAALWRWFEAGAAR